MSKQVFLIAAVLACFDGTGTRAEEPLRVGRFRQLFVDDLVIADRSNVELNLHQPVKYPGNPVLLPEHPWEAGSVAIYGTAIYDPGEKRFKMWYRAMENTCYACYATSKDGIHWEKPVVNVKPYRGSTANNIVLGGLEPKFYLDGFAVIQDPDDPDPRRRYKMLTYNGHRRFAAMTSPDGIHWEGPINRGEPIDTGDVVSMYRDTGLGKYVALLKRRHVHRDDAGREVRKRARLISLSDDFVTWSPAQWALVPDDKDPPSTEFYSHTAYMYEGMRIGCVTSFVKATERIGTQLCYSRDGRVWHRYRQRIPFLPNGPDGSFDAGMLIAGASGLIVQEGKIWIYYGGYNRDHAGREFGKPAHPCGIGLAHLRRDGFVSADAGPEGGTLLTRPLICSGNVLRINAEAQSGEIRAELLDAEGDPIAGHDLASAAAFSGDSLDVPLRWETKTAAPIVDRTIRIRFHLKKAKLYSFWFSAE